MQNSVQLERVLLGSATQDSKPIDLCFEFRNCIWTALGHCAAIHCKLFNAIDFWSLWARRQESDGRIRSRKNELHTPLISYQQFTQDIVDPGLCLPN